ncbi:MAG: hypothetical protein U9R51_09650 [Actinomycetota bacterium]|nr:hypothetical protein [Actinomycetota bacterium]
MIRTLIVTAALVTLLVSACSVQTEGEHAARNGEPGPEPGEVVVLSATLENDRDTADKATEDPLPPPTTSTTATTTTSTSTSTTTTTTTTTMPPPIPLPSISEPYVASESEPYADAKTIAGQIAQRLLTYDPDTSRIQLAAEVATADDQIPELIEAIQPAFHGGLWSRATVVYPQLGGLADDRMSVMVVVRQQFGDDDESGDTVKRTLDVRLMQSDGEWVFDGLASAGGDLAPRPADLSNLAITVVDHPNIILSDSARWDIYRGWISNDLLRLMLDLGDQWTYHVVTLTSGHPYNVFGTDTMSRHTSGHAVDLYRLGDARVIDDRAEASATHEIVAEWCTRDDISSIGSPWRFENPEPVEGSEEESAGETDESAGEFKCRSFTNRVHQDHIHISVSPSG